MLRFGMVMILFSLAGCVSVPRVDSETDAGSISYWSATCQKLKLTEDCGVLRLAGQRLDIEGTPVRMAANEAGTRLLVGSGTVWKDELRSFASPLTVNSPHQARSANAAFLAVKRVLDASDVSIRATKVVEDFGDIVFYVIELEREGYSLFHSYSVDGQTSVAHESPAS